MYGIKSTDCVHASSVYIQEQNRQVFCKAGYPSRIRIA